MENESQKWRGQVTAKLQSIKPDQAWSLLGDYFSLHKFIPSIATCQKIDGDDKIRYVEFEPDQTGSVFWAKEKLLAIDPVGKRYDYMIVESNLGLEGYFATLNVVGCDDGSMIECMFETEPVEAWTRTGLVEYLDVVIKEMAKGVGDALCMSN